MLAQQGDKLPVSAFSPDGIFPVATTQYEKRGVAINVPEWIMDNCIQCNQCAMVCPHAAIRPVLVTDEELKAPPRASRPKKPWARNSRATSSASRCLPKTAWAAATAPTSARPRKPALVMKPLATQIEPRCPISAYASSLPVREGLVPQHGQGQPVLSAAAGVLGRLRRLRRDALRQAAHPAVRRAHGHRQRHRLLLHLGRQRTVHSLLRQFRKAAVPPGATPCSKTRPNSPTACSWGSCSSARCWSTWSPKPWIRTSMTNVKAAMSRAGWRT
jgi:ferredoxin